MATEWSRQRGKTEGWEKERQQDPRRKKTRIPCEVTRPLSRGAKTQGGMNSQRERDAHCVRPQGQGFPQRERKKGHPREIGAFSTFMREPRPQKSGPARKRCANQMRAPRVFPTFIGKPRPLKTSPKRKRGAKHMRASTG